MTARFSKGNLRDELQARADYLRDKYEFDSRNGSVQLEGGRTHKGLIDAAIAYGAWREIERIILDIDCGFLGYGDKS